ncbi:uncharacterized protein LOC122236469 isoform X2 [Panthera tigris]|uniref:uncharacterized protein LOC122236469 isoform X2 n=1 Tax=Panthera tigris TaxID=9694 RepID=UPI001C6F626B|nr:uncharacterized protein LOC122236469 isoform X2 [Panthera tigris]
MPHQVLPKYLTETDSERREVQARGSELLVQQEQSRSAGAQGTRPSPGAALVVTLEVPAADPRWGQGSARRLRDTTALAPGLGPAFPSMALPLHRADSSPDATQPGLEGPEAVKEPAPQQRPALGDSLPRVSPGESMSDEGRSWGPHGQPARPGDQQRLRGRSPDPGLPPLVGAQWGATDRTEPARRCPVPSRASAH